MKTVRVTDLKTGDTLSSGAKVISNPFAGVRTPRGKVEIGIEYTNGQRVLRIWNKSTTVGVV